MKLTFSFFTAILAISFINPLNGQSFDEWFEEGAMRLDLVFTGTASESAYAFESLRKEPFYSGSKNESVDPFDYGDHKFEVSDAATGTLIFSHTYCTLYREWQTTDEAKQMSRAFSHVVRFPWPRATVVVELYDRDKKGVFQPAWSGEFDPESIFADPTLAQVFETAELEIHGAPEEKVDILFLAEGYTGAEMEKFMVDARRSMEYIFSEEPFKSRREDFNVRVVKSAGPDSGNDIPGDGIWKNTVMNSSFYTFGIERYMTTPDFRSVCDVAANAHYDQIYILVNTDKYGGGGIYNFYSISAADNQASRAVVIHEFGHGFAGLGDEYFNSSVAYNDFFPLDVEPWNPNLTTLVDFESKWKGKMEKGVPVPTPPEEKYAGTIGVYEGGGYVAKGVFRPMIDCRMHTNGAAFCPVCSMAIEQMIQRHTGR
ncbi:MAG: M64 family metallopeptidase [Bacteroides sp.]|nr:M64 family metallopeptidase [Bacteroides sp.]